MVEVVGWIALGISIINLFVYLLWINNNWKKSKIKVLLGFPNGKLRKINDLTLVDLKINVQITNIENKDTFIESMWVYHNEKHFAKGARSGKEIASRFKLPAYTNLNFDIEFSPNYNPKTESSPHQGYDHIFIIATDNKNRKFTDVVYYKVDEKNKQINSWFGYDDENTRGFLNDKRRKS